MKANGILLAKMMTKTLNEEEMNSLMDAARADAEKDNLMDALRKSWFLYGAAWMMRAINNLLYERGKEERNGD